MASLVAVLIVKDEEATLPRSLPPLLKACDAVVVADTGSSDSSCELASRAGATVVDVPWTDDFSAARNAAAALAAQKHPVEWVLVVDADEELVSDGNALRTALSGQPANVAPRLLVRNVAAEGSGREGWTIESSRLYRPGEMRYAGAAHEQLVDVHGELASGPLLPPEVGMLVHHGYANPADDEAKGLRNAELLAVELENLPEQAPPRRRAALLLDLGRSLIAAGRRQQALEVLGQAQALDPEGLPGLSAADFMARLLIGAGEHDLVLALTEHLREHGVQAAYCDHLRGQAMVLAGAAVEGATILEGCVSVDELIDASGRRWGSGAAWRSLALARAVLGDACAARVALDEAARRGIDVSEDLALLAG
ncbi:MAG: glycosyltransferase [Motilibacteraceae bacterium]